MKSSNCNVCESNSLSTIYRSEEAWSLTSTCQIVEGGVVADYCNFCGHIQKESSIKEKDFYEDDYQILTKSFGEDQLISDQSGNSIFRTSAQADLMLDLLQLEAGARVLDFGCAKGATAFQFNKQRPHWDVCLFDQSSFYQKFWEQFLPNLKSVSGKMPKSWNGQFDAVVSCYVLEHISALSETLESINNVLKPKGVFQFLVPNVWENQADLLVADHVNHFTSNSLKLLLERSGFDVLSMDEKSVYGAWCVVAQKSCTANYEQDSQNKSLQYDAFELGRFWVNSKDAILEFAEQTSGQPAAIYGAGFYGAFLYNTLRETEKIECFLDANPHRQNEEFFGKPVISPTDLPETIDVIYAGLNPQFSRNVLAEYLLDSWKAHSLKIFHFDSQGSYQEAAA